VSGRRLYGTRTRNKEATTNRRRIKPHPPSPHAPHVPSPFVHGGRDRAEGGGGGSAWRRLRRPRFRQRSPWAAAVGAAGVGVGAWAADRLGLGASIVVAACGLGRHPLPPSRHHAFALAPLLCFARRAAWGKAGFRPRSPSMFLALACACERSAVSVPKKFRSASDSGVPWGGGPRADPPCQDAQAVLIPCAQVV
jgi:hypothetical protein